MQRPTTTAGGRRTLRARYPPPQSMRLSAGGGDDHAEEGRESLLDWPTRQLLPAAPNGEHSRPSRGAMQSLSAALPRMSAFHAGVCLMLSVQNSSYVLLRRYSSGVLHEDASAQAILAVGELIKMGVSWYMIFRDASAGDSKADADAESAGAGWAQSGAAPRLVTARWFAVTSARLLFSSAAMAVPAFLFLAMNLLSFVALERISASSFTLIQQTKIIFTALLSRALLGKILSPSRWRALLSLLLAVLIICQQTQPQPRAACPGAQAEGGPVNMQRAVDGCGTSAADEVEWHAYAVGIAAVTTEAVRSLWDATRPPPHAHVTGIGARKLVVIPSGWEFWHASLWGSSARARPSQPNPAFTLCASSGTLVPRYCRRFQTSISSGCSSRPPSPCGSGTYSWPPTRCSFTCRWPSTPTRTTCCTAGLR